MSKAKARSAASAASADSFIFSAVFRRKKPVDIIHISGRVSGVFGLAKKDFVTCLLRGNFEELIHPDDRKRVSSDRKKLIQKKQPGKLIYRRAEGKKTRWIEEQIFPGREKLGTQEVCSVIQDITENIEVKEQLELSEKKYRSIFEKSLAGVYRTHVNGEILECNQTFATILGYSSPEDLKKRNVKEIYFYSEDRRPYIERLRKEGTLHHFISILKRKDGRRIIVDNNVSIANDKDGKPNIIEGTLIDITEIHDAKLALELGEKKYRLLFEESKNAIVLTSSDDQETIIDINRIGQKMFGSDLAGLLGVSLRDLIVEDIPLSGSTGKTDNEEEGSESEVLFKRQDGSTFYGEVWASRLSLSNENFAQITIHDISNRKRREQELMQSRQSFKNIVDRSLSAILIFDDGLMVYKNPVGESLYKTYLNSKTNRIGDVFPARHKSLISELLNPGGTRNDFFTEITLSDASGNERSFSISAVDIVYNQRKSKLFVLHDISLQNEYHMQKHRAELAEYANRRLQTEIEEHRKTQTELIQKTSILQAFHESSKNLFVMTLNKDFRLSSMNANFRNAVAVLLGKEVKEGDMFLDLFEKEPGVEEKIQEKFRNAFAGEPQEIISHFPTKKGEFWVETFINPIFTEGRTVEEISLISHDISEKIEIQNQIKNSEAGIRAMLLAIPDFIFRVSSDGVFKYSRLVQDLGLLREVFRTDQFVGQHITDVFVDEKIAQDFVDNLNIAFKTEGLHTQLFSFSVGEPKNRQKRYFENRFSKVSEEEMVIISRDITESMEYESRLIESVREKEVLLKEVHHRVKNNLQVINSILNLQSTYVTDPKTLEFINESQNRIRSMSYIHESLYQTKNFNSINFRDYITTLVQNLVHSYELYGSHTELKLEIQKVDLALDQAIPCGLILNELISNALKYAYPEGRTDGVIAIRISEEQSKIKMEVEDFGVGLPPNFSFDNTDSLGLSLVETLVKQLDGEMQLSRETGTKFLITFDKQEI
jgi:PAS domain S-box-containing protein